MTRIEKQVYHDLLIYSENGKQILTLSNQELSNHFGCSIRSLQRTLASLRAQGYISVEIKTVDLGNEKESYWTTVRYMTVFPEK